MSSLSPIGPVDAVDAIPAAQLRLIAGTVDQAIASLDPGTMLAASVASVRDGVATLRVGSQLVQARSDTPLAEGERLLLRVDQAASTGNQIMLRRVDVAQPQGTSPLQGARLSVPSASLAAAVSELDQQAALQSAAATAASSLTVAEIEIPALSAQVAAALPFGQLQPATVAGNVLTVAGQQVELPEALPVPDDTPVQVAAFQMSTGVKLVLTPPAPNTASASGRPRATESESTAGPPAAGTPVAPGQNLPAIAVVSDRGSWLQVGQRMLPAEPAAPLPEEPVLPAGGTTALPVIAQVVSVQGGRTELFLSAATADTAFPSAEASTAGGAESPAKIAAALQPLLGADAPAVASLLAARGAPAAAAETKLAARVIAGQDDPVDLLRGLAAMFPVVAQQVEAIEQDATAGSGKRLKQALARIGLEQEAAALRSDQGSSSQTSPTVKDSAQPAQTLVGAQQLLVAQPPAETATSYFFLPLPNQGKAQFAVERSKDAVHVRGELEMTAIGEIGFHLTGHDQGLYAQIDAASASVAAHLERTTADLRAALEKASGKPAVVTVAHRQPRSILPALPAMIQDGGRLA